MATTLSAGDIAIVGKRGVGGGGPNDDSFAFVVLRDIDAGTIIKFTDHEWVGGAGGGFNVGAGDGEYTYSAGGAIAAGTVITVSVNGATSGNISFPSGTGDQIFAYQGTLASPTLIDAFQDRGAFVAAGSPPSNTSELPPGVVLGTSAVAVGANPGTEANWAYEGTTSGSAADLRAAIHNPANWNGDATYTNVTFPTSFAVGAPPSPAEINVSGNGNTIVDGDTTPSIADHTQFGQTAVVGGAIDRTFTIANQGGQALSVSSVTITGANAGDFSVFASPGSSVAGSGTTTFTLRFDPSAGGLRTASISIANGDSDENPYNFNVSGSGISATPTALGAGDIAIVGFNATSGNTQFSFVLLEAVAAGTVIKFTDASWTGTQLNASENAVQWVAPSDLAFGTVVQFDESNLGPNFQVTTDGGFFSGNPLHVDTAGDQIFGYVGTANSPTFLGGVHTDNSNFDANYVSGFQQSEVPPGLVDGQTVLSFANGSTPYASGVYAGSTTGDQAALLAKINNEANWTGSASTQTLPSGTFGGAGSAPEIDVHYQVGAVAIADGDTTPVTTDGTQFDPQDVTGGSQSHTFVIRKLGDTSLNLGNISITGANASDFNVSNGGATTLGASQSATITVTFDPSAPGARTAIVTIPSNDADEPSYDFVVRGLGRDAAETLEAGDIAFSGYDSASNRFSFVLLADVAAGTSIKFTDGGWNGTSYRASEGAVEWIASDDLVAGTVITYNGAGLPNGGPDFSRADTGYFTGSFDPDIAGDQIIAYQGTATGGGAGLVNLAALYYDKTTFDGAFTDTAGSSLLPAGLVDGQTAISFGKPDGVSAYAYGVYTGPTNLPFAQQLLALNDENNWSGNDSGVTFATGPIGQSASAVAFADEFSTDEATPVSGNVFANNGGGEDFDSDGPALAVGAVNGSSASVGQQITLASGALLTLNADGTFDYDSNGIFDALPAAGSGASNPTETDSFSYTLVGGGTTTVTVTVSGLDSDDTLLGTGAANVMNGGIGEDTLLGLGGDDTLRGGEGDDTLDGGAQNDTLDGGRGADDMTGGTGNDSYVVNDVADVVDETGGDAKDTVFTSIDYTLAAGIEIGRVFRTTDGLSITGNSLSNTLVGGAGDDTLSGAAGRDTLDGRAGADEMTGDADSDRYFVDDAGDQTIEAVGGGTADMVFTSVDHTLDANVEIGRVWDTSNGLVLTGNGLANQLFGGTGADTLNGAGGRDRLTGGAGGDTFHFTDVADSVVGGHDVILDFAQGVDLIDLSAIDAVPAGGNDPFTWLGAGAFTHTAGELRIVAVGQNLRVEGDVDGDGRADLLIAVTGLTTLSEGDFIL